MTTGLRCIADSAHGVPCMKESSGTPRYQYHAARLLACALCSSDPAASVAVATCRHRAYYGTTVPIMGNMTSSTKPEYIKILHRRQRRGISTEKLVKFGPEMCSRTNRQTDTNTQTHTHIHTHASQYSATPPAAK